MYHLLYNIRANHDFRGLWLWSFGSLLALKLVAWFGYMVVWPIYNDYDDHFSEIPLWLEVTWRFLGAFFFIDWLSLVPLDKFCVWAFHTDVFHALGAYGALVIVLVWVPLVTLGEALFFAYLRVHRKYLLPRWKEKMAGLRKAAASKIGADRLRLAVWLTPLTAFLFHIAWSLLALRVNEGHAYEAAAWWPWDDKAAIAALYLAPHSCLAVGMNSIVFALIRRQTPLFIAGSFNLLAAALLYLMVVAATYF